MKGRAHGFGEAFVKSFGGSTSLFFAEKYVELPDGIDILEQRFDIFDDKPSVSCATVMN